MRGPRTSIAGLVCLVVFSSITFASLRHASLWWSRVMLGVAICAIGLAIVRAWCGPREARGFWVGFALVGSLYLLVTLSPRLGERMAPRLPTTRLFTWLYPKLYEPRDESITLPRATFDQSFSDWSHAHPHVQTFDYGLDFRDQATVILQWLIDEEDHFVGAGHAALAVIFGWLGGCAASLIAALATRQRRPETLVVRAE